jgi:hypothetical protein
VFFFLTSAQIIRGLGTRKFLANHSLVSHRFIYGINGFGTVVNLLLPFRMGDILRLILLSRRRFGLKVASYFLVLERLSDLIIANIIFFILSVLSSDFYLSPINPIGFSVGVFGITIIFLGTRLVPKRFKSSLLTDVIEGLNTIFHWKEYFRLFVALVLSWGFTTIAILIMSQKVQNFLQSWILINSSYSDPYSYILNREILLIITLLIPLSLAFAYSFSIPSAKSVARRTIQEFVGVNGSIQALQVFKTPYAGSGAVLYIATISDLRTSIQSEFMIRVEVAARHSNELNTFMIDSYSKFGFPKIYFTRKYRRASCTILEFITDHNSGIPSQNLFELLVDPTTANDYEMLEKLLVHIKNYHKNSAAPVGDFPSDSDREQIVRELNERVRRACAFAFMNLNQLKMVDRTIHFRIRGIRDQLISSILTLQKSITLGVSHGDATLSNFLIQKQLNELTIRSIDPNTRFSISNIEYDLAKVMQSTHSLFEFYLKDTKAFPSRESDFRELSSQVGWQSIFNSLIYSPALNIDIDKQLLNSFFMLHLIRIVPYRVYDSQLNFKKYLNLLVWVSDDVNL